MDRSTQSFDGSVERVTTHGTELFVGVSTYDAACVAALNEVVDSIAASLRGLPLRTHSVAEIPLTTSGQTLLVPVPVDNVLVWTGDASDQYESSYQLRSINGQERLALYGHRGRPHEAWGAPSFTSEVFGAMAPFTLRQDPLLLAEDVDRERHVAEFATEDGEGTLIVALPRRTRLGARVMQSARFAQHPVPTID